MPQERSVNTFRYSLNSGSQGSFYNLANSTFRTDDTFGGAIPGGYSSLGNWSMVRSVGNGQNSITEMNKVENKNFVIDGSGSGVDVVMVLSHTIDTGNEGYFRVAGDPTTSRIKTIQWNTLPGLAAMTTVTPQYVPTIKYEGLRHNNGSHAEAVLALACHSGYSANQFSDIYILPVGLRKLTPEGWTNNSNNYVAPTDIQRDYLNSGVAGIRRWAEIVRHFHATKSGLGIDPNRPTLVIQSMSESLAAIRSNYYDFRNSRFYTHKGQSVQNFVEIKPFGAVEKPHFYNPDTPTAQRYINLMTDSGIHYVLSASNKTHKIDWSGIGDQTGQYGYDYNNKKQLSSSNREYYYNREGRTMGTGTIVVGNMECIMGGPAPHGVSGLVSGKEFAQINSNRGQRVDTFAGGCDIPLILPPHRYYNRPNFKPTTDGSGYGSQFIGHYKYLSRGTSFSCPTVGGLLACVLEKYPTTTPMQLRQYVREKATGDPAYNMHDPTPPLNSGAGDVGDPAYFENPYNLQGYSGHIFNLPTGLDFDPTTLDGTITYKTEPTGNQYTIELPIEDINSRLQTITGYAPIKFMHTSGEDAVIRIDSITGGGFIFLNGVTGGTRVANQPFTFGYVPTLSRVNDSGVKEGLSDFNDPNFLTLNVASDSFSLVDGGSTQRHTWNNTDGFVYDLVQTGTAAPGGVTNSGNLFLGGRLVTGSPSPITIEWPYGEGIIPTSGLELRKRFNQSVITISGRVFSSTSDSNPTRKLLRMTGVVPDYILSNPSSGQLLQFGDVTGRPAEVSNFGGSGFVRHVTISTDTLNASSGILNSGIIFSFDNFGSTSP